MLLAVLWMALMGCAEKLICPAYQSVFIHDKEALRQKFSYFVNDSTPKVYTASKTKYLIAEPESYKKLYRRMQTVPMVAQNPVVPDSLQDKPVLKTDSLGLDSLAVTPLDSVKTTRLDSAKSNASDSVYMITRDKEIRILRYNFPDSLHRDSVTGRYVKEQPYYYVDEVGYNAEQVNYMWYFRKQLILPDARIAKAAEALAKNEKPVAKKKGGFFRKLMFWKKDKKKKSQTVTDSLQIAPPPIDPHDSIFYNDSASQSVPKTVAPTKPKKKSVLGLLKRKEKPTVTEPPKSPAKKEEDGF